MNNNTRRRKALKIILRFLKKDIITPEEAEQMADNIDDEVAVSKDQKKDLGRFLSEAFVWEYTPQGHGYWGNIAKRKRL